METLIRLLLNEFYAKHTTYSMQTFVRRFNLTKYIGNFGRIIPTSTYCVPTYLMSFIA